MRRPTSGIRRGHLNVAQTGLDLDPPLRALGLALELLLECLLADALHGLLLGHGCRVRCGCRLSGAQDCLSLEDLDRTIPECRRLRVFELYRDREVGSVIIRLFGRTPSS